MDKEAIKKECSYVVKLAKAEFQHREYLLNLWKKELSTYKTIVFYGCGRDGVMAIEFLENTIRDQDVFFVDRDATLHGKSFYKDILCYNPDHIFHCDSKTTIVLVASTQFADEITRNIYGKIESALRNGKESYKKLAVNSDFIKLLYEYKCMQWWIREDIPLESNLHAVLELFNDDESLNIFSSRLPTQLSWLSPGISRSLEQVMSFPQYFPNEIKARLNEHEIFLDCGAFTGDTIEDFCKQTNHSYESIYAFEMDATIAERFKRNPRTQDKRIHLFQAGVGEKSKRIRYVKTSMPSCLTAVHPNAAEEAEIKAIDDLMKEGTIKGKVTFVKMDIEGAEMDALRGMQNLILRDKPKLAICVYHKPEDLWQIPLYIHRLVPEYQFILRHHSAGLAETVLYAYLE